MFSTMWLQKKTHLSEKKPFIVASGCLDCYLLLSSSTGNNFIALVT